ncbi:hypothetical protein CQZ93_11345 [Ochrobactrum vermis]|nr:hypothetical protein CQZ93_11345 [Ochrobactrum vermis]
MDSDICPTPVTEGCRCRNQTTRAIPGPTESLELLYLFGSTHYPTHRSGVRNQSSELISPRRRFTLLLEMLFL